MLKGTYKRHCCPSTAYSVPLDIMSRRPTKVMDAGRKTVSCMPLSKQQTPATLQHRLEGANNTLHGDLVDIQPVPSGPVVVVDCASAPQRRAALPLHVLPVGRPPRADARRPQAPGDPLRRGLSQRPLGSPAETIGRLSAVSPGASNLTANCSVASTRVACARTAEHVAPKEKTALWRCLPTPSNVDTQHDGAPKIWPRSCTSRAELLPSLHGPSPARSNPEETTFYSDCNNTIPYRSAATQMNRNQHVQISKHIYHKKSKNTRQTSHPPDRSPPRQWK